MSTELDAVIIGSGPNGLSAAITLARAGYKVMIFEAHEKPGGGVRTEQLTLPGYLHDVCSSIHPLAHESGFFKSVPLNNYGLKWIYPTIAAAHPFDDHTAAFINGSFKESAESLKEDAKKYTDIIKPFLDDWDKMSPDILAPLHFPDHPILLLKFGIKAMQSASGFVNRNFEGERARSLFAGMAAHAIQSLDNIFTAAFGIILSVLAHKTGWPFVETGSQKISDAMIEYFNSLGGVVKTNSAITSMSELPSARVYLFDITPAQILKIEALDLPETYKNQLKRYQYGSGVFKIDYALNEPIPFKAKECREAGTLHLGGLSGEIIESENIVRDGGHPEKPFLLLSQTSLFDKTRSPQGRHTAWVYTHVPNGSTIDMTQRIENQIERFAPGFKEIIADKHILSPSELQNYNANYIGGDINGGLQNWRQLFTRPVISLNPYKVPVKGVYICSSSTPPGGGVHGMCGYFGAQAAIKELKESK